MPVLDPRSPPTGWSSKDCLVFNQHRHDKGTLIPLNGTKTTGCLGIIMCLDGYHFADAYGHLLSRHTNGLGGGVPCTPFPPPGGPLLFYSHSRLFPSTREADVATLRRWIDFAIRHGRCDYILGTMPHYGCGACKVHGIDLERILEEEYPGAVKEAQDMYPNLTIVPQMQFCIGDKRLTYGFSC